MAAPWSWPWPGPFGGDPCASWAVQEPLGRGPKICSKISKEMGLTWQWPNVALWYAILIHKCHILGHFMTEMLMNIPWSLWLMMGSRFFGCSAFTNLMFPTWCTQLKRFAVQIPFAFPFSPFFSMSFSAQTQQLTAQLPEVFVPGGAPPDELKKLCMDPVPVVKAAARDHWVALGGHGFISGCEWMTRWTTTAKSMAKKWMLINWWLESEQQPWGKK